MQEIHPSLNTQYLDENESNLGTKYQIFKYELKLITTPLSCLQEKETQFE